MLSLVLQRKRFKPGGVAWCRRLFRKPALGGGPACSLKHPAVAIADCSSNNGPMSRRSITVGIALAVLLGLALVALLRNRPLASTLAPGRVDRTKPETVPPNPLIDTSSVPSVAAKEQLESADPPLPELSGVTLVQRV